MTSIERVVLEELSELAPEQQERVLAFVRSLKQPTNQKIDLTSGKQGLWGAQLAHALQSGELDTSEWVAMPEEEPVEWLRHLRENERTKRDQRV